MTEGVFPGRECEAKYKELQCAFPYNEYCKIAVKNQLELDSRRKAKGKAHLIGHPQEVTE